jgi:hypothetical protein
MMVGVMKHSRLNRYSQDSVVLLGRWKAAA